MRGTTAARKDVLAMPATATAVRAGATNVSGRESGRTVIVLSGYEPSKGS